MKAHCRNGKHFSITKARRSIRLKLYHWPTFKQQAVILQQIAVLDYFFLPNGDEDFTEFNDIVVRRLIEFIRVMPDGSIEAVLKGGMKGKIAY